MLTYVSVFEYVQCIAFLQLALKSDLKSEKSSLLISVCRNFIIIDIISSTSSSWYMSDPQGHTLT